MIITGGHDPGVLAAVPLTTAGHDTTSTVGYVALLDVLGFRELVAGDRAGKRLQAYLDTLNGVLRQAEHGRPIKAVVFSDSIVLTADGNPDDLHALAWSCSLLLYRMTKQGIALRGAIAHGSYLRSSVPNGVFVAGTPIIAAYEYEKLQDWVGVMLTPGVLSVAANIPALCRIPQPGNCTPENLHDVCKWPAVIHQCNLIPFHGHNHPHDGFAIVPGNGAFDPESVQAATESSVAALHTMRLLAPNPAAQSKFLRTANWFNELTGYWGSLIRHLPRPPFK